MFNPMAMASGNSASNYMVTANQRYQVANQLDAPVDHYHQQVGIMHYVSEPQQFYQGYASVEQENLVPVQEWNHPINYYQEERVENGDYQQWDNYWKVPFDQQISEVPVQNHDQDPVQQFQVHDEVPVQMVQNQYQHQNQMESAALPTASQLQNAVENPEFYQANWQMTQMNHQIFQGNAPYQHQAPLQFEVPAYINEPYQSSPTPLQNRLVANSRLPQPVFPIISITNLEIWKQMHSQVNEMFVRVDGRQLAPRMIVSVANCKQDAEYQLRMKLVLQSTDKFQYKQQKWEEVKEKKIDPKLEMETIELGKEWMSGKEIETGRHELTAKIYNIGLATKTVQVEDLRGDEREKAIETARETNMFRVVPLQKYIPVVSLYEKTPDGDNLVAQIRQEETEFLVVTKIKNPKIQKLKADCNKYCRKDFKEQLGNQ